MGEIALAVTPVPVSVRLEPAPVSVCVWSEICKKL